MPATPRGFRRGPLLLPRLEPVLAVERRRQDTHLCGCVAGRLGASRALPHAAPRLLLLGPTQLPVSDPHVAIVRKRGRGRWQRFCRILRRGRRRAPKAFFQTTPILLVVGPAFSPVHKANRAHEGGACGRPRRGSGRRRGRWLRPRPSLPGCAPKTFVPAAPIFPSIGPTKFSHKPTWAPLELVLATPLFLAVGPLGSPTPQTSVTIEGLVATIEGPTGVPMPCCRWFGRPCPAIVRLRGGALRRES